MGGPSARTPEDRHFVTALARGLELLACFRAGDVQLGNQEIAQRCGLPKSTVSRLTGTLTRLGYLVNVNESGKYRLGDAVLALGHAPMLGPSVRAAAHAPMQALADATGAEVALAVRTQLAMFYAEHCHSTLVPRSASGLGLGMRLPLDTSAAGRAWMAVQDEDARRDLTAQIASRRPADARRIEEDVAQAVSDYRTLGVACSFGDWRASVNAIARAFSPGPGLPVLVINCGGQAIGLAPEVLLAEVRSRLIEAVAAIEAALVG